MSNDTEYTIPTMDQMLANGWYSSAQRPLFQAVADSTKSGTRIGTLPFDKRSLSQHETRASQKHSELLLAAHALVAVGLRDFDLHPGERPDFSLSYGSDSIDLEVAELVEPESARVANAVENIRIAIRERVDQDPTLGEALGHRYISLRPWVCPKRSLEAKVVDEFERLIRSSSSPTMLGSMVNDTSYPAMKACKMHVHIIPNSAVGVDFATPPTAFDPHGLVSIAGIVLGRKREKAASYTGGRLWLVMAVTDNMGSFDASVDALGNFLPDIAPFEMVVIRGSSRVAVWTATQHIAVAV